MRAFSVTEVGIARTPYKERREAPFQPGGTRSDGGRPEADGVIEVHAPFVDCLADLEGFERIWLLYVFDRNQGFKTRVRPPRDPQHPRGLFSTRAPHRPSPIGLTAARLVRIEGARVHVAELDLLDGTPVIDIKPYLPFADAFPGARMGWLDEVSS